MNIPAELANMMAAEPKHLQELVQALNAHTGDPARTKPAMKRISEISGILVENGPQKASENGPHEWATRMGHKSYGK